MRIASLAEIRPASAPAATPAPSDTLPIARPLLPSAYQLRRYLREIDANRVYSNFGPLVSRLETRLAQHLGLESGRVVTVANATLGLAAALAAQDVRQGAYCLIPAWTFVATAHAAIQAGLIPYFVDVDAESWALEPDAARQLIARLSPGAVGAVMPVAPFGRPLDLEAWDRFAEVTGIPVVIDAAAAFDALRPSRVPAIVSLHATKALGAGEGGFLATTDAGLAEAFQRRINFGFFGDRNATVLATNAKMSEYNAAVALAALDGWEETRARLAAAAAQYRRALSGLPAVRPMAGCGSEFVATTFVVELPEDAPPLARVERALAAAGVPTRRWWGNGLHRHDALADSPSGPLGVTERLAERTLGLPFWIDMSGHEMARVAEALAAALELHAPTRWTTPSPSIAPLRPAAAAVDGGRTGSLLALDGLDDPRLLAFAAERVARRARGRSALELGLGTPEEIEARRARFDDYAVVDASAPRIADAARRWAGSGIAFAAGALDARELGRRFENVILSFVLEQADDPGALLRNALERLVPNGRVFVIMANAKSLERRLLHRSGRLPDYFATTAAEKAAGRRRRYDAASLRVLAAENGGRLQRLEGLFLNQGAAAAPTPASLSDAALRATLEVGLDYPELCAAIIAEIAPAA